MKIARYELRPISPFQKVCTANQRLAWNRNFLHNKKKRKKKSRPVQIESTCRRHFNCGPNDESII